jgi:hypothetical protein
MFVHDRRVFLGLLFSVGIIIAIVRSHTFRGYKPSYNWPKKGTVLDLTIGVAGLGADLQLSRGLDLSRIM